MRIDTNPLDMRVVGCVKGVKRESEEAGERCGRWVRVEKRGGEKGGE